VDTRHKNLAVTRAIVESVKQRPASTFAALRSVDQYVAALMRTTNWRDFYGDEFDMPEAEVDRVGRLWAEYQLADETHSAAFPGIPQALGALADLPHGIVSQNGRANIRSILEANDISHYFASVIGYEEVDLKRQKPAPDGLLQCLEELTQLRPGYVFYVGDHATDALCAAEARAVLRRRDAPVDVVSIAMFHDTEPVDTWPVAPDHAVRHPADIVTVVRRYVDGLESAAG
jgi:HAD superfamily hydrolase (TIGR01549 family)